MAATVVLWLVTVAIVAHVEVTANATNFSCGLVPEVTATTTTLTCGRPPDMPDDVTPGIPISNVHEPLPGPSDHVCQSPQVELVQEVVWLCDELPCCTEPCVCHAGHHSEEGCGNNEPLSYMCCYGQQNLPLRYNRRVCCEGFEEDDSRNCLPVIDCGATGGSICEQICVNGDEDDSCSCLDGFVLHNRTHCVGIPAIVTTHETTTTTPIHTTTQPIKTSTHSRATTTTTSSTTTTTGPPAVDATTTTPIPTLPDSAPAIGPVQGPLEYDADSNQTLILAVSIPLFLLLLLLGMVLFLCWRRWWCKPGATPHQDAAFANLTYAVVEEGAVGPEVILSGLPEKKIPPDDLCYDNGGYMMPVDPSLPPPYSEKPDPHFQDKRPIDFGPVVVGVGHSEKCPLPDVKCSPMKTQKQAYPNGGSMEGPPTVATNHYEEIPSVAYQASPRQQLARDQNEVNELSENIYSEIK